MASVINKEQVKDINLAVLKRVDPEIEQVLGTAAHVCLYAMTMDNPVWERKNIEGSLFLLKRKTSPRFQIAVLNKLSTENYTETIHGSFDVEISSPYLMYTLGDGIVHGIWFYDEQELDKIASLLNRVKAGLPKPDAHPAALQGEAAALAAASGSSDEGGFWDKTVEEPHKGVQPTPPFSTQASEAPPSNASAPPGPSTSAQQTSSGAAIIENLFRSASLKNPQQKPQPQAQPVQADRAPANPLESLIHAMKEQQKEKKEAAPAAAGAPQQERARASMDASNSSSSRVVGGGQGQDMFKPLPPSFFTQQQRQQQQQQQQASAQDSTDGSLAGMVQNLNVQGPQQKAAEPFRPSPMKRAQQTPPVAAGSSQAQPHPNPLIAVLEDLKKRAEDKRNENEDSAAQRAPAAQHKQPPALSRKQQMQRNALACALENVAKRPEFIDMVMEELQKLGFFPM